MSVKEAREAAHIVEAFTAYCMYAGFKAEPDVLHDLARVAINALEEYREKSEASLE